MTNRTDRPAVSVSTSIDDGTPITFDYGHCRGRDAFGGLVLGTRAHGVFVQASVRNLRRLADEIVFQLTTLDPGHYTATLPETAQVWEQEDDELLTVVMRGHVDRTAFVAAARTAVARHNTDLSDEDIADYFDGVTGQRVKHEFWRPAGATPAKVDTAAVTDNEFAAIYFPCEPSYPGAEPVTYLTLER